MCLLQPTELLATFILAADVFINEETLLAVILNLLHYKINVGKYRGHGHVIISGH